MSDNLIRECMCVFEDRVQRYGPYFAWAYVEGRRMSLRRPDLWTRAELKEGLDDMNAFELGYTMSFASLQSVVWRVLCNKANCSLQNSWSEAKRLVEYVRSSIRRLEYLEADLNTGRAEMAAYELGD